ncbi:MAG: hypothetical protein ABIV51_13330, partial [Saprospiraceae bacterium]
MLRFYFLFVPALFVWFSGTSKPVSEVFLASSEPAHDRYTTNLAPCDPIADSLQLVQLFNATGGFDWTQPWDLTQPMTTWTGVILNVEYCVGVVNLSNNNLSGNIPDLQLPNCTVLNLEGNHLEGTIPNFTGLPGLQLLILNNNNLEGNIPDFTSVVQLIQFSASENNLFGSVPSFTNTPKLKTYELAHNKIIGILPNFQNLPLLQLFNASYNNITGNVPNFLNLQNLKYLILNHNKLEGSIPNFFLLNELRELDLSFNKLTGPIPNFVNLRKMTSMQLNNNLLSGTIPNFAQLDSITERIWLQSNQLSGLVPNFTKLNRLIELNLDDNVLDSLPIQEYLDSLLTLKIRLNGFTFDDLIPNKDVAPYMFNYPQDSVGTGGIVDLQIGQTYTIHLGIDPSLFNSLYRWYKNGVLQQITTSNSYTISNAYPADAGVYMCFISNSDLPQVTLFSKQFFVRVNFNNSQYNDDCQNAITILELNGHCNEYTMTGATPDLFSGSCAVGQNNVWFRFVAEGPNIFITGTAENGSNIEMAIIEFPEESCDPNTAIELFCALGVLNKTNLLVQGKVYYLVVSSDLNGEGPFELCVSNPNVPPPPPNDAICNALAISPNGHCRLSKTISASIDFGNDQCPALSQQSVWFKTTLSAKKNRLKIDLLTNTFVSDVSIMVCTLNPDCNSTPTVVTNGRYCGSPDNIFIVNGLQSGIQYYIQISTTKQGAGVFEMCLYEEGDPLNCAENQNCNDGVNGPALIATVTGAGKVCLNGCNTGAKIALNIGNANCFAFTNPTVWYRVLTDATADLLSIDLASGDFDQPQIAILTSSNCAAFAPIACNIGVNGQVKLENVKVSPNSWYLIAVTESGGGTGSFTICAETKADSP